MSVRLGIIGYGTALPEYSLGVDEAVDSAERNFCGADERARRLRTVYRKSGVDRRHMVVLDGPEGSPERQTFFGPPTDGHLNGPPIRDRMQKYEDKAAPLALEASREALERSGVRPEDITHIVTVSCSGFAAPGVDIALIKNLGLSPTVERAHIGFMGCHGALNGLKVARGFVESDPNARVLLCAVELCSLHYHYGTEFDRMVANALFADGAAAIVGTAQNGSANGSWQIGATGSCLLPDSEDDMSWRIHNHGFVMSLSARVPELIRTHLRDWLEHWLSQHSLSIDGVRSWAVHPGGPKILDAVAKGLDLPRDALDVSREILRDHGNMSSPTVLFVLKALRDRNASRPCVALGFGPGLMAEATLFV